MLTKAQILNLIQASNLEEKELIFEEFSSVGKDSYNTVTLGCVLGAAYTRIKRINAVDGARNRHRVRTAIRDIYLQAEKFDYIIPVAPNAEPNLRHYDLFVRDDGQVFVDYGIKNAYDIRRFHKNIEHIENSINEGRIKNQPHTWRVRYRGKAGTIMLNSGYDPEICKRELRKILLTLY